MFLNGSCSYDMLNLTVSCTTTLDATQVELDYMCSYNSGPFETCNSIPVCWSAYIVITVHVHVHACVL